MPYKKEYHTIHCTRCGNDFEVLTPAYMRRLKDPKYGSICPTCRRIIQEEEMTPEEKRLREEKRQKTRAEKRAAMTDEEKEEFARNYREKCQAKWRAKSEEELQAIHDKQSELQHNRIAAMSDERRAEIGQKISETKIRRNQEMSEEERAAYGKALSEGQTRHWANLTEEERAYQLRGLQEFRDSLTDTEQELKFRELFHEYHLDDTYRYVYEDKQERDGYSHQWDYGIYSKEDDQLVMLVDIDATAFHGDFREYDADSFGLHSDFTRQKTIPDRVRGTVIRIKQFWHNFHVLTKELQLPYDAFVEERMKQMRFNGFPFPEYRDIELQRSYEDLRNFPGKYGTLNDYTKNAQVGMWLVHHFHPSIYRSHVVGKPSPYEAVQDDVQLRELVENHTLFRNNNDPNKLLQGFDCCEEVPKIHVFSPNHARILIQRYLSEFSTIYDPMCEFSSTLLGTVSLGKRFIGLHYSDVLINESNQLIKWLQSYYPETNAILQRWIPTQAMGEVSCMLTRFPGSQQCIFEQSPMNISPDEFIRQFMKGTSCKRYVFVVPSTEEFRDCVADTIVDRHDPDWKELVVVIDR